MENDSRNSDGTDGTSSLLKAGYVIDEKYRIEEVLGSGGHGTVYKATHLILDSAVAIKVTEDNLLDNQTLDKFKKEFATAASLRHSSIINVLAFGSLPNGQPYIVMDYFAGATLEKYLLEQRKLSFNEFFAVFIAVCSGLKYAHEKGIVHSDIKPSNIMIALDSTGTVEFVKIVDFGLAKPVCNDQDATRSATVAGTSAYMSPEQCTGIQLDQRSDIYSLGCVMYESLTGKPAFSGSTQYEIMYKHLNNSLSRMSGIFSLPVPLANLISQCLKKSPGDRPQNISAVEQELIRLRDGQNTLLKKGFFNWAPLAMALGLAALISTGVAYKIRDAHSVAQSIAFQEPHTSAITTTSIAPLSAEQVMQRLRDLASEGKIDSCISLAKAWSLRRRGKDPEQTAQVALTMATILFQASNPAGDTSRQALCETYARQALLATSLNSFTAIQAKHLLLKTKSIRTNTSPNLGEYHALLEALARLDGSILNKLIDKEVSYDLGCAYVARGDYKKAREYFLRALSRLDDVAHTDMEERCPYYLGLANADWSAGQKTQALKEVSQLAQRLPQTSFIGQTAVVQWYLDHRLNDEALARLAFMRKQFAGQPFYLLKKFHCMEAAAYEHKGMYREAKETLKEVVRKELQTSGPESPEYLLTLSSIARLALVNPSRDETALGDAQCALDAVYGSEQPWASNKYGLHESLMIWLNCAGALNPPARKFLQDYLNSHESKDPLLRGHQLIYLGEAAVQNKNFTEAAKYFTLASEALQRAPADYPGIHQHHALARLADQQIVLLEFGKAEQNYIKSANLAKARGLYDHYIRCGISRVTLKLNNLHDLAGARALIATMLPQTNEHSMQAIQLLILLGQIEQADVTTAKNFDSLERALRIADELAVPDERQRARGRVLLSYGARLKQFDQRRAVKMLEEAYRMMRATPGIPRPEIGQCAYELGLAEASLYPQNAENHILEAVKIALCSVDQRAAGCYLVSLAILKKNANDDVSAESHLLKANSVLKQAGDARPEDVANLRIQLAQSQRRLEKLSEAERTLAEGISDLNENRAKTVLGRIQLGMLLELQGEVLFAQGFRDRASQAYAQAEKALERPELNTKEELKNCLMNHIRCFDRSSPEAERLYKQLISL